MQLIEEKDVVIERAVELDLVALVQDKMASGAWIHPKNWTDLDWEAYFEDRDKG